MAQPKSPQQIIADATEALANAKAPGSGVPPDVIASMEQGLAVMEHRQAQQDKDDESSHQSSLRTVKTGRVGGYTRRMQATKQFLDGRAQAGHQDISNAMQQNKLAGVVRAIEEGPLWLLRTAARISLYAWNKTHHYQAVTQVEKAFERAGITRQELGMTRRQFRKAITNG